MAERPIPFANTVEFYALLGCFYAAWSRAEIVVDCAIWKALGTTPQQTHALVAAMEFGRKAVLRSLLPSSGKDVEQIKGCLTRISIRKIATEIVRLLPSSLWLPLLVQVLILAAAPRARSLVSISKTRGKNLATKAGFKDLQDQLSANTELVETIKVEVGQKDWARREWTAYERLEFSLEGGALPT
jgi:hypothetical protein